MIVKRAFQTDTKPAPVLFLTVRSAVEQEAGGSRSGSPAGPWKVVSTDYGTARVRVPKKALRPGRNTVRVRFAPADGTAFTPSRSRLRTIRVAMVR